MRNYWPDFKYTKLESPRAPLTINSNKMPWEPETYHLKPNKHAPNSDLPVLVYRGCLPLPLTEEKVEAFFTSHAWERRGIWGHIWQRHFHPNSHECYGVLNGESRILVGCGHNDTPEGGIEIEVMAGDVIVLPAGTGHCNLESTKDYRYMGVYPEKCPRWRNELGKTEIDHEILRQEINGVEMPLQDPVNGVNGPLMKLWLRPAASA